ncbi:MAG: DUF6785 family protein [Planctomycetota bacterium]|jgi:hypothetical protein
MSSSTSDKKGFNWTSASIGCGLLVVWTLLLVRTAPTMQVRRQYPVLILAFGAILTLFIIKLAAYRPNVTLAALVGLGVSGLLYAFFIPSLPPPAAAGVIVALTVLIAVPLYRFMLRRLPVGRLAFSPAQLSVIYAILIIGIGAAFVTKITIESASEFWKDEWHVEKWLPPHFLPKYDAKASPEPAVSDAPGAFEDKGAREGWLGGRSRIPWTAWLTGRSPGERGGRYTMPLFFWICLVLTFEFFFLLVALAFRRRYIEEERLAFPMARFPLTIIGDGTEGHDRSIFRRRATWIGLALGFAVCAYPLLRVGPTGYAQSEPQMPFAIIPTLQTRFDLTGYKIVPGLQLLVWLSPFAFLFIIFSPLEVLSTAVLTFFVTRVLIAWILELFGVQERGLPGYLARGIVVGGLAGLAFWSVVFNAGTFARFFGAFFGRKRGPQEATGLLSFRNLLLAFWAASLLLAIYIYPLNFGDHFMATSRWLLLAGTAFVLLYSILSRRAERVDAKDDAPLGGRSVILLLACMGLSFIALTLPGRSVALLIGGSAVIFAYVFGTMRIHAESPFTSFDPYRAGRLDATLQARYLPGPSAPGIASGENGWWNTAPGVMSHWLTWGFASFYRMYGPQGWFLDAFKVGHESGASNRDILRAVVTGLVLGCLIAAPLTLRTSYTYGYVSGRPLSAWYEDTFTWMNRTYIFGTSSMEPPRHYDVWRLYTLPLMCFLIVGVMMYLRREYAWFPFHPVGFIIGAMITGPANGRFFWFTILVAWAFKKLIFKWFGVRFFRDKVRPVLVFAMMGMVMAIALYLLRFTLEYKVGLIAWR